MNFRKSALFASIAVCPLVLASAPAAAQDSSAEATTEGDTIVVTGIRESLQQSVNVKRNAPVIADVISSEDLGRFPDTNVAESLQRITGVQIQKERGEGSQVSIRGLPPGFTQTTLNGRNVASAFALNGATRSFEFAALPSEFVNRLEVYKTPTASIPEGGLSGTLIIRTPRPLDVGKQQIALSAQGVYEENSGKVSPRLSAIYTDTFADGTLGVTLGAAYSVREPETQSLIARGFRRSARGVQNIVIADMFKEKRERLSLVGTLEWEPVENGRIYLDAFYTDLTIDAPRYGTEFQFGNSVTRASPLAVEDPAFTTRVNGLATKLKITNAEVRAQSRWEYRQGETYSLATGGDFKFGDWGLKAEANYSKSYQDFDNLNIATLAIIPDAAYDATLDDVISMSYSAAAEQALYDPKRYRILSLNGAFGNRIDHEIYGGRVDLSREFEAEFPLTLKFGADYSRQHQTGQSPDITVTAPNFAALTGSPASTVFPGQWSAEKFITTVTAGNGSYVGSYSGPSMFPTTLVVSNTREFLKSTDRDTLAARGTINPNLAAGVDVIEEAKAGYVQFDIASSDGSLNGNVGLRYVHTRQTSAGVSPDLSAIIYRPNSGGTIVIPGAQPIAVERSYDDWLPSFNLSAELSDAVVARFALSRTMARPNLGDLSPSTTPSPNPPTITQRNPYLDPFRSNNVDAALEWYFDDDALLSATVFYKDVLSLITNDVRKQMFTVIQDNGDGTTQPAQRSFDIRSIRNGSGATLKGIELSLQDSFDFLPSLLRNTGVLLNYTYLDNSKPRELVGASKHNMNATLYYESAKVAVRGSYTWRSQYLLEAGAQEGDGRFVKAGGSLDGNFTYNFTDNLSAVLEGTNLLNDPIVMVDGNGYPAIFEDSGRRILFGVRAKF